MSTKPYNLRLSDETLTVIKTLACRKELSVPVMCRVLINERLEELGLKPPAVLTLTSETAGAHNTHAEVMQ